MNAASKAPVADVVVTVTSTALKSERIIVTNVSGEYRVPELPPGEYNLYFEKEGFKPHMRAKIPIDGEQTIRANEQLVPEAIRAEEIITVGLGPSVREKAQETMLLPSKSLEIGGELTFLFGDLSPDPGKDLDFTDVTLATLSGRYSFGAVELAVAGDLLVKEPIFMDEPVPQSASLALLAALGERQAIGFTAGFGPLVKDQGRWESATLAVYAKRNPHETLSFKGMLGTSFTHLGLAAATRETFWFSEVVASLEAVVRTPRPGFAVWASADLHVPVAYGPSAEAPDPAGYLDPQTRVNFAVATAYSFVRDWDVYVRFAFIDRGDSENPQSMLPILNGGFDQKQLTIGVVRDWDLDD